MKPWVAAVLLAGLCGCAIAQQPAAAASADAELEAAASLVGRALFLRCFCAGDSLTFDEQGHVNGPTKQVDWTLAGVNVLKVARRGPREIELDGVRVAIRYATDRHEFDRHPQNDEAVHITMLTPDDAAQFAKALEVAFATGIDRPLQRSMPPAWRHYFEPELAWPDDSLTGQNVMSFPSSTADATIAVVTHRADAGYTAAASRDHVAGTVRLRFVVDTEGVPRRIAIVQPLGYGLDEKAVEALAKYRLTPAMYRGRAVATNVSIDEEFKLTPVTP